ncbi:hypothetical protein ACJ41O_001262 [Fusarium nematophilum]
MTDRATAEEPSQGQPATGSPTGELLPAEHWAQLEGELDESDRDSALSDNSSSTASLTSSILEYRTILGRSFHSERGNAQYCQIDDCTQEWTFKENSADYVHARWLVGSVQDWEGLFKQAYRALKPGGYLESHETSARVLSDDGSVEENSALGQWGNFFIQGGHKLGRPFTVVEDELQEKAMEAAGFVDVRVTTLKCPIGAWPRDEKLKEVGRFMKLALGRDVEGAVIFMADLLGWKKEEIAVYAAHLRRELASNKFRPYYRQNIVIGRKPDVEE